MCQGLGGLFIEPLEPLPYEPVLPVVLSGVLWPFLALFAFLRAASSALDAAEPLLIDPAPVAELP
jgi:hypothetical protein